MLDLIGIWGITSSVERLGLLVALPLRSAGAVRGCALCAVVFFLGVCQKKASAGVPGPKVFFFFLPAEHCMVTRG